MKTTKKIKIPIYNFTLYVTIFDKWEEVTKYYVGNKEIEREGFLLINNLDTNVLKFFVNVECPSCIVHEIIHIKNVIFDIIEYKPNIESDEPEAYLVQYIYKEIFNVYNKHKDNAKK